MPVALPRATSGAGSERPPGTRECPARLRPSLDWRGPGASIALDVRDHWLLGASYPRVLECDEELVEDSLRDPVDQRLIEEPRIGQVEIAPGREWEVEGIRRRLLPAEGLAESLDGYDVVVAPALCGSITTLALYRVPPTFVGKGGGGLPPPAPKSSGSTATKSRSRAQRSHRIPVIVCLLSLRFRRRLSFGCGRVTRRPPWPGRRRTSAARSSSEYRSRPPCCRHRR